MKETSKHISAKRRAEMEFVKALFAKMKEEGDMDDLNSHLSAAYLLHSLAIRHHEEAMDVLDKYGVHDRTISKMSEGLENYFDGYNNTMRTLLDKKCEDLFMNDYDKYGNQINKLLGFDVEDGTPESELTD